METLFLNKNNLIKINLPLALDRPISSKALVEGEIVMPFENIKSKGDAVIYCFQHMDLELLNDILDDDLTYEDISKPHFLSNLKQKFKAFSDAGDTYLKCFKGSCDGRACSNKKTTVGFDFKGNKSKKTYTLIVDIVDGNVLDLYECHGGWMKDFEF